MASQSPRRQILVSVDFGTTYSGIAWAQTARPDVQTAIVQWPDNEGSLEGATSDKVPTQICYIDDNCVWGYGIPEDERRYQWFKLALDPDQQHEELSLLAIDFPDVKALPPGYDYEPNAVKLTTDYLTQLHQHTLTILQRKLGESVVDTTPVRYTVTVPAIWSDAAKAQTLNCASAAGMGRDIQTVSEPEAAVLYALDSMDPYNLQVGDNFVLCDAGGGTVDLITYKIISLKPIVQVQEVVPGSGNACGSTFLNRIFRKYLEENLSDLDGFGEDTLEDALSEFEANTKRKFTGNEKNVVIRVPGLSDNAEKGVRRQKLTIKGAVLRDLFKPVMTAITTLVKCQLQQSKEAKAVILVGGFGQSPYLRSCIRQVIGDEVEIMQPAYGWTAVVRGALLKALHDASPESCRVSIASRKARRAYGTEASVLYSPTRHAGREKYWDPFAGQYVVTELSWLVKEGDPLDQKEPISQSYYTTRKVSTGRILFHRCELYTFESKGRETLPQFPCPEVKKLVDLFSILSAIPKGDIPVVQGDDGLDYYRLDFEIKVAFFSAHMEFSLWHEGKKYGVVDAQFT